MVLCSFRTKGELSAIEEPAKEETQNSLVYSYFTILASAMTSRRKKLILREKNLNNRSDKDGLSEINFLITRHSQVVSLQESAARSLSRALLYNRGFMSDNFNQFISRMHHFLFLLLMDGKSTISLFEISNIDVEMRFDYILTKIGCCTQ